MKKGFRTKRGMRLKTIRALEKLKKPKGTGYEFGTRIVLSDMTEYLVTEHGNWVKVREYVR